MAFRHERKFCFKKKKTKWRRWKTVPIVILEKSGSQKVQHVCMHITLWFLFIKALHFVDLYPFISMLYTILVLVYHTINTTEVYSGKQTKEKNVHTLSCWKALQTDMTAYTHVNAKSSKWVYSAVFSCPFVFESWSFPVTQTHTPPPTHTLMWIYVSPRYWIDKEDFK